MNIWSIFWNADKMFIFCVIVLTRSVIEWTRTNRSDIDLNGWFAISRLAFSVVEKSFLKQDMLFVLAVYTTVWVEFISTVHNISIYFMIFRKFYFFWWEWCIYITVSCHYFSSLLFIHYSHSLFWSWLTNLWHFYEGVEDYFVCPENYSWALWDLFDCWEFQHGILVFFILSMLNWPIKRMALFSTPSWWLRA